MASRKPPIKKLTKKQQVFCKEYLIDLNATQAAIRAGYSKKTAGQIGDENLKKPEISHAIQLEMNKRAARTEITVDRVLKELARIAFADPRKIMKWNQRGVILRDSETLTDDEAAAVCEVTQTITDAGGSIKIKLNDKNTALQLAGRHLKMYTDKLALGGDDDAPPIGFVKARSVKEAAANLQGRLKRGK